MSKKIKAAQKEKRLAKKRAMKAANQARYVELRRIGQNSKSIRFKRQSKRAKRVNTVSHPNGKRCGNIGCRRCDPCGIFNTAAA